MISEGYMSCSWCPLGSKRGISDFSGSCKLGNHRATVFLRCTEEAPVPWPGWNRPFYCFTCSLRNACTKYEWSMLCFPSHFGNEVKPYGVSSFWQDLRGLCWLKKRKISFIFLLFCQREGFRMHYYHECPASVRKDVVIRYPVGVFSDVIIRSIS